MKHLFFLFVGLLALYEIMKALNCKKVYSRVTEYNRLSKDKDKDKGKIEACLKEHPLLLVMIALDILTWVTLISGLMISQWILFLMVIVLSLSRFQRLGSWAVLLDSIITTAIYLFAIINTYHLHIEL